jgi:uncharacterized RDD family membrane protein YckC
MKMITKTNIERAPHKHLALFDHRGSLLLLYAAVGALSLALALMLEFGVGLSPSRVLLVILPTSVLLLLGIPYFITKTSSRKEEFGQTDGVR